MCKIEKKLCKVFKDILESREGSRRYLNTFSVKQNVKSIQDAKLVEEYKGLNSSYKRVVHNLSSGTRHPLLLPLVYPEDPETADKVAVTRSPRRLH